MKKKKGVSPVTKLVSNTTILMKSIKSIKDTVHGLISIDDDLMKVVDTPIFQRLGKVKQLTSAEYVFPGARHTRKEHCIGAMHLASKYAIALGLSPDNDKLIKLASLLHDVAHGPYSHSWDTIVYVRLYPGVHKGHDRHRHSIIHNLIPDIFEQIGVNPDDISKIWNNQSPVLSAILQGPLGVDRMDFVSRDTLYTATTHFGFMEIDRIINNSSIHTKEDGTQVLAYHEKVIPDAIQGLTSRLYMYNKVYLHKTVIAAAILIEASLQSATDYYDFIDRTENLEQFTYLNDSILDQILSNHALELAEARYYARRVYHRELPKLVSEDTIYLSPENKSSHLPGITIDKENNIITWVGRILSNDFPREFSKHDIHVVTGNGTVSFETYWQQRYPHHPIETYYIKRVYSL